MGLCYTLAGQQQMLNALKGTNPTLPITHVGALEAGTPLTGVTGEADDDTFTKTSHGMSDNQLVLLSGLTGGTGLDVLQWYFVRDAAANTFKLCRKPGDAATPFSTDVTALTVTPVTELTGGSYARVAIAYNNTAEDPNGAVMDDSTNGAVINVPGGSTVDYIGGYSASSAGTLLKCTVANPAESFTGDGTYTVNDDDLKLAA